MIMSQAPPQVSTFMLPLQNVSTASVAIDIESDPMAVVTVSGKDEASTQTLETTLNGLLTIVKGQGQQAVATAPTAEVGKVLKEILDSLQFTRDGETLTMNIPKPEGFGDALMNSIVEARAAAKRVQKKNNLRQVALGLHNFHSAYRLFPYVNPRTKEPDGFSWRVRILPFIEEQFLWESLDLDKGVKEAPNAQFADQMPKIFGNGGKISGIGAVVHKPMPKSFADITDGTSNTIAFIEAPTNAPWMEQPAGFTVDEAIKLVDALPDGGSLNVCMYDGSVRELPKTIDKDTLRALLTHNGGERVDF